MRKQAMMAAWMAASVLLGGAAGGVEPMKWAAPGPNIALGKTYEVTKAGKCFDYDLSKDEGDKVQLTDGAFAPLEKHMWWYKETVAWYMGTIGINIDLGEVKSIAGIGYSTDSGPHAGIGYPPAIVILVSDDGKEFRVAGELIGLAAKFGPPPALGRHWFRTDELKTHGRYVQLVIRSGYFILSDEVEIYGGKPEYLQAAAADPAIDKPVQYVHTNVMPYAVSARLAMDTARARAQIGAIGAPEAVLKQAEARLEELRQAALKPEMIAYDRDFRAIAPMNPLHAQILAAVGPAYRAAGYPEFVTWTNSRWARQTPFDGPAAPPAGVSNAVALSVRLAQNDRRGEVVNVANFSGAAKSAVVSVAGLPGGTKPAYLTVKQAEYVAMPSRPWDADALPAAEAAGGGWKVSLPAGMSRQLWLDFQVKPGSCPAGTHQGELVVKVEGGPELRVPLALTVADVVLPEQKAVSVGNWDYTHGGGRGQENKKGALGYALHEGNVDAAIKQMRDSGVTVPWAIIQWSQKDVWPCWGAEFDEADNLIKPANLEVFDAWIKSWPGMKHYAIVAGIAPNYGGAEMGTEKFNRRLGAVMKHWAAHIKNDLGVDPSKIVILILDEPGGEWQANQILAWGKAIRAAVPEFKFIVDPTFGPAMYTNATAQAMFDLMDIVIPGTDYCYQRIGKPAVDFYESIRAKGKIMGFYACAQNPSEAESTRYYRLQQWACWQINKGGPESWAGFWAYSDTRGNQPWNQLPCGYDRNWSPVYIDSKSVTDGKHWLAIFEGANDYEYMLILKNRIEEARKAGRNDEAVAAAEKLLAELPDEVIVAVRAGNEPIHSGAIGTIKLGDINACDTGRIRVLDALAALAAPAK